MFTIYNLQFLQFKCHFSQKKKLIMSFKKIKIYVINLDINYIQVKHII
jgi:hypothetical protein